MSLEASSRPSSVSKPDKDPFWEHGEKVNNNKKWPGLPRGVKFAPSDEELLWHLLAEIGEGGHDPHPFIGDFIISLDEDDRFGCSFPHKLPGVKQDGSLSYFFHRPFKAHENKSRKRRKILNDDLGTVCWHKIGKTKPVYVDGIHKGSKKVMILFMTMEGGEWPEKTNWMIHQYHVGVGEDVEGKLVISKIFYQLKFRQGDRNAQDLCIDTTENVGTEAEPASKLIGPEPHVRNSNLLSMVEPSQATCHDRQAEETNAYTGWKPGNNNSFPTKDSKNNLSQFQFPVDSQQQGNLILACTEAVQRQSSRGFDMETSKSCLSENAELGDHEHAKVLECRTHIIQDILMDNCDPKDARSSRKIYCNTANEGEASQAMLNSSHSMLDAQADTGSAYLTPAPMVKCETSGQTGVDFYTSDMLDRSVLSGHSTNVKVEPSIMQENTCNEVVDNISPAAVGMSELLREYESNEIDHVTLQERYTLMLCGMNHALGCHYRLEVSQDMEQCAAGFASHNRLLGKDSEVGPREERHEAPLGHLESSDNISASQDSSFRPNINSIEECLCGRVKDEIQPADAHEECHLHSARHDDARSMANPLMESPDSVVSGTPLGFGQFLPSPVLEANHFNEKEESRDLLTWQASASEVRLPIISREPGHVNDMNIATCSMTVPCLPEATSPDDPSSARCKSQQYQERSYRYPGETCILGAELLDSVEGRLHHNDYNHPSDTVPSVFPLEVKAEPLEESNTKCTSEKNAEELSSPHPETDLNSNKKLSTSVMQSCSIIPKLESVDSGLLVPHEGPPSILPEIAIVKRECIDELTTDIIDHIPLSERMQMLTSTSVTNLSCDKNVDNALQTLPPPECDSSDFVNAKTKRFSLRRKRKKTATDSVETALEEDAPGLLQVLLDKGITVEEIKLYGDMEDDAALPICSSEDSFEELETIITKLFSEGPSIFKFPSVRQTKGSKALYCLACLISLIEQARYLHFRQSPVEWGWCRDLQSFIFVFERHNRIVLERPEYGYATYFFELVESLPVDWQIKRLVTAMKLPCCSRTILLENKPLLVGEDLTEGEACVMEEYGWIRNSGLGTMLCYCDRVVHDKKNERYSLEWRSKIGKLLMKGHDSGHTVLSNLPKKVAHYIEYQDPEVKLET